MKRSSQTQKSNNRSIFKSILLAGAVVLFFTTPGQSQVNNAKTETVKVYGNCSMCEASIEKAANKKKISQADWDKDTKMAVITYDSMKTTLDDVLKSIALAGYDNQSFLAPDEAYNKLPGCCKYDREKKQALLATQPGTDTTAPKQNNAGQEINQVAPVFESYFSLKDALIQSDGNTASAKAKDLQTAINAVKMEKLSMNVHTVWMKILNDLKEDAEHINGTKDLAHQRDYFMSLSKNMYALIKVAKLSEPVFYQFCPMANDGKGANWLSKENPIKNPYYGTQMLTCGKTVETIKQ